MICSYSDNMMLMNSEDFITMITYRYKDKTIIKTIKVKPYNLRQLAHFLAVLERNVRTNHMGKLTE